MHARVAPMSGDGRNVLFRKLTAVADVIVLFMFFQQIRCGTSAVVLMRSAIVWRRQRRELQRERGCCGLGSDVSGRPQSENIPLVGTGGRLSS